jgi:hypothetical protein
MSLTTVPANAKAKTAGSANPDTSGIDRRRRRRAKISAQLHIQLPNSPAGLDEVCTTIDVSRDGLLFVASRSGYTEGQMLDVTFPYSTGPGALNQSQPAEIVRVAPQDGKFAVAIQFVVAKAGVAGEKKHGYAAHLGTAHEQRQPVVLAVESDVRVADVMRNILGQDGYTMVVVKTAQEALDFLQCAGCFYRRGRM